MKFQLLFASALAIKVTLFDDVNFGGVYHEVLANPSVCTVVPLWFNDRASSATIDTQGQNGITCFYRDPNCMVVLRCWGFAEGNPWNFDHDGMNDVVSSIYIFQ
jgi:hypothetical protein